jgi:hypothetical protein
MTDQGAKLRRIVLGCGALLLGALALFAMRAGAQNGFPSTTAPVAVSVVRSVACVFQPPSGLVADADGRGYFYFVQRGTAPLPNSSLKESRVYFTSGDRVDFAFLSDLPKTAQAFQGRSDPVCSSDPKITAGNGERGSLGDGGPAISAQLNLADVTPRNPNAGSGIAIDSAGNLFVSDTLNDTVRRVDAETGVISSVAGKWASIVTPEGFANPIGVAADANGNLYITANNAVYRLDAATGAVNQIANIAGATAIAVTRDGAEIYVVAPASGTIFQVGEGGVAIFHTERSWAAPSNITEHAGLGLSVFATSATAPGTDSNSGLSRLTAAPTGIALDANGNVFVSEASANIIERVDAKTLRVTRLAGTQTAGYSGDGGVPLKAQFNTPGALAFDHSGNLFVADLGNSVIREITNASPAQAGSVTLSPNSFNFGDQLTGGQSTPQAFTLTNGTAATVSGIAVSFASGATPPDFTQTNSCNGMLAAGASCVINVIFSPQAFGQRNATLYVTDSDPTSPQTASLSGTGDDFELSIPTNSTDQLTVIDGETATFIVQAAPDNVFNGTITLNCPYNLPVQTTCTITTATATTPPSLTLTPGGAPQTFNMALKTTFRTSTTGPSQTVLTPFGGSKPQFPAPPRTGTAVALMSLLAAALGIAIFTSPRLSNALRPRLNAIAVGMATMLIVLILAMASACGSNTTGSTTQTIFQGTPAGTYNMTVTATAQGATRGVNITLIVQ